MDTIKPLYTATATAVGGRNGHTKSSDGIVSFDLSVPKEMGGPGRPGTATPEHLFAAGYAACFGGAIDFVAKQHKLDAANAQVTCAVSIGPREGGGFGLAVTMRVEDKSFRLVPSGPASMRTSAVELSGKLVSNCPWTPAGSSSRTDAGCELGSSLHSQGDFDADADYQRPRTTTRRA
jgi:lipoyl-dependent peroxiredoxin